MSIYRLRGRGNRKGVFSNIQLAIIAVAALIIFSLFLFKVYDGISDRMAVQDCKNSIAAHSMVARGSFNEIFTDIKCPTREITIKKLDKANEIIAEDMHRCWYIWGKGTGQYFEGDGTFCHICSVYQFGDKGQEVTGLYEYLVKTDVPVTYAGETRGIKYIDYFQGYSTPNADREVDESFQAPAELDTINTSERYATIFVYASGKDAIDKVLESGKRTTAITGLSMFGTAGTLGAATAAKIGMAAASGAAASTAATGTAAATAGATSVATTIVTTQVSILTPTGAVASQVAAATTIETTAGILIPTASATGQAILAEAAAASAGGAIAGGATGGAVTGGVTASTAVLGITPIGWVAIGVGVLALTGVGIYMLLDSPDPEWIAYIAFRPYNVDELKALGCEKMAVNQMSNVGTP